MPRKKIPATELHDLLTRQFRDTAGDTCLRCGVPMPVFRASKEGAGNWRIGAIDECSTLCHTILADVAARLAERYDLKV